MTSPQYEAATPHPFLRALRITAGLAVATVFFQFLTAGRLFPRPDAIEAHEAGAVILHVMSGLAAISAVVLWRRGTLRIGVAALAAGVFVLGFAQAAVGGYQTLYLHVPGAMLLTAGSVWLLVAVLLRRTIRSS